MYNMRNLSNVIFSNILILGMGLLASLEQGTAANLERAQVRSHANRPQVFHYLQNVEHEETNWTLLGWNAKPQGRCTLFFSSGRWQASVQSEHDTPAESRKALQTS
jgi:hypothetical protein